jgi:phosphoenolpyruvate carboxylase
MDETIKTREFDRNIRKKFNVYNSLIQNLRYNLVENVGMLLPILSKNTLSGLDLGEDPVTIVDRFFQKHTGADTELEKIDFMFKVIQYVERQVVLYDSVEDAAFPNIKDYLKSFSIDDFFQLMDGEKNWDKINEKLSNFSARIVLTAHPTQFYPPAVLNIMHELRENIQNNELNEIDQVLQQLGLTSLMNAEKPTPLEEASHIIYLMRHVYYDAIGSFYQYIRENVHELDFDNPNLIKLGFWPGGDRDGNPFVTAETTRAVADELRMTLMKCYYKDAKALDKKLSFKKTSGIIKSLRQDLYNSMFHAEKPVTYASIIDRLYEIRRLVREEYFDLYLPELEALIDKVRIFKTHFASLDIRQDHSVHRDLITWILKKEQIIEDQLDELGEDELIDILVNKEIGIDKLSPENDLFADTLKNIKQLRTIQEINGEEGCNRYIISNSEDIFSVLFVYALFRWSGYDEIPFDILPLFETMKGMQASEKVMTQLFSLESYRHHLRKREEKQSIMLGFSDGTKDGGYLQANWSIIKTKETLSKVCDQFDIKAIFFDGRGGPPARGGGKSHRFYAAQSPDIADHEIQLTIQGQTITSKYGTEAQFIHHSEQIVTAALFKSFFGEQNSISTEERQLIEQLADTSYKKYTALKMHPKFIPYLEQRSTLKYYGRTNIGSRPGKRGKSSELTLSDLRAISFVGSWSQLKQNVPGYFGLGTALKRMVDGGKVEQLQALFRDVPVFKALILNSMMSLSKCNFGLTNYLKKDAEFSEFWHILYEEYKLSIDMVLMISGYSELMEEESISRQSIRIREKIVLPLLIIQQYALQKVSQGSDHRETYEKIITRSLFGNVNASRNSA